MPEPQQRARSSSTTLSLVVAAAAVAIGLLAAQRQQLWPPKQQQAGPSIPVPDLTAPAESPDDSFRHCLLAFSRGVSDGDEGQDAAPLAIAVFPQDGAAYTRASSSWNERAVAAAPAAVLFAAHTSHVSRALTCAQQHGVRVSPAAGRQNKDVTTVMDDYLVVDVSNMTQVSVDTDAMTVTLGAGSSNAHAQAAVADSRLPGVALPTGSCSFVGIAGWLLGGGFGLLGRQLGLGCDSLLSLEVVLFNGTVVTADAEHHPDLFWASCGGGGGTFGIATIATLKLSRLPNQGRLTSFKVRYARGPKVTTAAYQRFLAWVVPGSGPADSRFGFHVIEPGNAAVGAQFSFMGVFLGPLDEALAALEAAGLLADLDPDTAVGPEQSEVAERFSHGLVMRSHESYWDFFVEDAPTFVAAGELPVPWAADGWRPTETNRALLLSLLRGEAGMRVVGGHRYHKWWYTQARLLDEMTPRAAEAIVQFVEDVHAACAASNSTSEHCYVVVSTSHILGGRYAARAPDATAFPHRHKLMPIYAQMDVPVSALPGLTEAQLKNGMAIVDSFVSLLASVFPGKPLGAYANYQPPAGGIQGWQAAFWGDNYPRLQAVKAAYDPLGMFDKPLTVQPAMRLGGRPERD